MTSINNNSNKVNELSASNSNTVSAKSVHAVKEKNSMLETANNEKVNPGQGLVQTGLDRYITVQSKRKRSPRSPASGSVNKFTRLASQELPTKNRFDSLVEAEAETENQPKPKQEKPPLIYLREESNRDLIKMLEVLTEGNFYVSGIKRGNIKETKIQTFNIDGYRALVAHFEKAQKRFYTYQLKSQKGLVVILKGIESFVEVNEIDSALNALGFHAKSIINIMNKERIPQPMFRVELEPESAKVKAPHAIFKLQYLLHRRITVEEPKKRTGPIQCIKCQEYGHTRAYCTLNDVCVICGELHNSKECTKPKADAAAKRCSNCSGNHTANYRGCPVYMNLKQKITPRQRAE